MAEMSHPLPEIATASRNSLYARMIPGAAGAPSGPDLKGPMPINESAVAGVSATRNWMHLLPTALVHHQAVQLATVDFLVLLAACLAQPALLPTWRFPALAIPAYSALVVLLGFIKGIYKNVGALPAEEFPVLVRSAVLAMTLVMVAAWNNIPTPAALTAFATSLVGLLLWRQVRRMGWNEYFRQADPRNVLIVGAGPTARAIDQALRGDPFQTSRVVGFLDDQAPLSHQVLGRVADLDWLARSQFIDEVILALPNDPKLAREAAAVAVRNHLDIQIVPDLPPGCWSHAGIERIGGVPVITLHHETPPRGTLLLKRLFDWSGAAAALTLLAPVMGLLALLIRLDSPGPVLYSAQRTGAKGHPFRCYKFRSMTFGADQLKETLRGRNQRVGPIFKLENDPRITRFGRFMRRYSFDELPQLWNVLRGDMSLVGPRPHPVDEVKHYQIQHYRRLDMKPGITGLWQITARNSPSFDLNMHLDLTYIENWTLALDLRILLSTIRVFFVPEGA